MASCVGLRWASVLDVLEVDVDLHGNLVTEAQDVTDVFNVADGDRADVCLQDGAQGQVDQKTAGGNTRPSEPAGEGSAGA